MDNFRHHFQKPILEGIAILSLIPQRVPMVMIDRFFGALAEHSFSALTIDGGNIFCRQGKLTEEGIIEHFAQSAAARIGYLFRQKNEPVPIGFIGAVSRFSLHRLPAIGEDLKTVVTIVHELDRITLARVQSWVNDEPVAEGELKIFLNDN